MRLPIADGFYPSNPDELRNATNVYLKSEKRVNALGAIVPHAGYVFSGSVAGETFKSAKTDKKTFVLFGPNHTGYGPTIAISSDDWKTPLGVVKTDKELVKKLKLEIAEIAHRYEHSLEVQLPFLQTLYKDFSIAAIAMQQLQFDKLEEIAKSFPKDAFYVASSDFTHFGPNYGYEPIGGSVEKQLDWVKKTDSKLIDLICKLDAKRFYSSVTENDYTVCGFVPITLLILIAKRLGAKSVRLVSYKTSYEVMRNSSFVSYAGIVFE
ncbi:MAG: AmmeMemoRadiSam system protein B [Candidatus Aenigmatarchaeota archaeon]